MLNGSIARNQGWLLLLLLLSLLSLCVAVIFRAFLALSLSFSHFGIRKIVSN